MNQNVWTFLWFLRPPKLRVVNSAVQLLVLNYSILMKSSERGDDNLHLWDGAFASAAAWWVWEIHKGKFYMSRSTLRMSSENLVVHHFLRKPFKTLQVSLQDNYTARSVVEDWSFSFHNWLFPGTTGRLIHERRSDFFIFMPKQYTGPASKWRTTLRMIIKHLKSTFLQEQTAKIVTSERGST